MAERSIEKSTCRHGGVVKVAFRSAKSCFLVVLLFAPRKDACLCFVLECGSFVAAFLARRVDLFTNLNLKIPQPMWNTITKYWRRRRMSILKPFANSEPSEQLRVSFCDTNWDMADALHKVFHQVPGVEVLRGNLLDLECDALMSPANSFGDMSGGIDKAIDDFFRGAAQKAAMDVIAHEFYGELPVGMATIVPLPGPRFRHMVCGPTMRIPQNVSHTINAYLAMRAAFVAILKHNRSGKPRIQTFAVPGLCTGVGAMDFPQAASQMRVAYDNVIGGKWEKVVHPAMAPYAFDNRG